MVQRFVGVSVAVLLSGGVVLAQAPKPGPEHKSLGYFVGKWKTEADMKASPFGPGGKMTSADTCEWFAGGFQVVCRGDGKGPAGPMTSLGVLSYDANEKAYKYYGIDNTGMSDLSTGRKSGNTWSFSSTAVIKDQKVHSRFTIVETSPTAYTFKWESSPDGKTWSTVGEGKTAKATS